MKVLAIIPARGGSKRLPLKNIKLLLGKPLICWTLDAVKNITEICDVLVSTDDDEISAISRRSGALVPWVRPEYLSTDEASSVDVVIHALDWYEENVQSVDCVLLLQPTSPFRTSTCIRNGLKLFERERNPVIAVSRSDCHPSWNFKIKSRYLDPYCDVNGINIRSQDLEPAYVVNGCLYLISPNLLRSQKSFFNQNTLPLIIESSVEAVDIDTIEDWQYAEYVAKNLL
ncbi:cytidylyltransferase domain-containing protein [Polynucleobacter sp. UB-Siik-W21]|uniref:acylneuraminate cytidylyltransferase family protein n=1 Tax=Polynucleobacter sp. UB-Siik-W21 TaxID=1855646 RepID=UPI001BFD9958|nr:acylneuraminate cytidylyltransferase family protein [Polynucleobacter sp. UB-Siik-W21]QWD70711.1 acylneuraminate cytidylyltransferase family protein [Polynucleobacter sp. UB-Siik-W21]